jgi:2,4-dienoyl-CoA reductase (NADPH2)
MSTSNFEKLLEPINIAGVKTRNRMVKSGAAARYWTEAPPHINPMSLFYYEAIARGGIGLLVVEGPVIEVDEKRMKGNYRLDDDKYIKDVAEITRIIHKHNCPCFVQLNDTCNWQKNMLWGPKVAADPPKAASPVCVKSIMDNNNEMPREIRVDELQEIVNKFGEISVRLQKAGFDGIEINAASTHLIHSFLSPFWNKRHDEYGCDSLENRARFLLEIIHEVKKRNGRDYPIEIIINGLEFGDLIKVENEECLGIKDVQGFAKILESNGVDAIQVRSQWLGRHDSSFLTDHFYYPEPPVAPSQFPKEYYSGQRGAGANILLTAAVKQAVKIPVIVVGRMGPELGEQVIRAGQADLIAMTRRLIADPDLPNKVAAGKIEDIVPCTSCTTCKVMGQHRRCRINARIGSEQSYVVEPAKIKKNVVVVGGGPAGMEAARVAALRGHKVTLFEKTGKLGGELPVAATVKGIEIEDIPKIITYFEVQLKKLGVQLRLGQAADENVIAGLKPDVVILATGGNALPPNIPGINHRKVVSNASLHGQLKLALKFFSPDFLNKITKLWMPLGKSIVIIGGGIQGCELGEFLIKHGRKVTIVDTAPQLGEGMINHLRLQLLDWFEKKGVTMITGIKEYLEINDKGLVVLSPNGYKMTIQADNVVPAVPLKADTELFQKLQGKYKEIYCVGDCKEPKLIVDAIGAGFNIARSI